MSERYVHLSPRLLAASELLRGSRTVADVGCDHGRLTAALLQQRVCECVIATDISAPSLEKARRLIGYIGLTERVSFREGSGLTPIHPGECDAVALLGMGGTLMARILEAAELRLMGASRAVLQPMRAQADIRAYLHRNRYRILEDRIVREGDRLYQLILTVPDEEIQTPPAWWPSDCYEVGFVALEHGEPLLPELIRRLIEQHRVRLSGAVGTAGEPMLREKLAALETVLSYCDRKGE